MTRGVRGGGGITPRVLLSWVRPGRVVSGLRGMTDASLVVVLLVAMLIFLIAQLPDHARAATLNPGVGLAPRIAGAAMAVMFLMPLVAYGVAQLVSILTLPTRWELTGKDSRLALFWALLAVAPAMLLSGLVAGLAGPSQALSATRAVAGIGFLFIWVSAIVTLVTPRRRTLRK